MAYLIYDQRYLDHIPPFSHPENPARLSSIISRLTDEGLLESFEQTRPRSATVEELKLVHPPAMINSIRLLADESSGLIDPDTYVSPASFDVALLAVGGVLVAVDSVTDAGASDRRALCLVRPPGHHATTRRAMGFCLLNNVAIAAAYARAHHGIEKVAIVDIDVHHGNGTQEIFWKDSSVLYVSLHQMPLYPGSGAATEKGEGEGYGSTLNIPLEADTGDDQYLEKFRTEALPKIREFSPGLILVSLGFDGMAEDPIATLSLTERAYAEVTAELMDAAEASAEGRIVLCLEGGYDPEALARGVSAVSRQLLLRR